MTRWNIDEDEAVSGQHVASLFVSLHFLRAALQRRWKTVAAFVYCGVVVALAAMVLLPPASSATTSLVLAHPAGQDPVTAMATDVSLLRTRTVAQNTIDTLNLSTTADELQSTITVATPSPDIMSITITAASPAEAVRRLGALSDSYVAFRSEQVRSQSDGVVAGDRERIKQLQEQSTTLSQQYGVLARQSDASSQAEAADVLTHRSQLDAEIATLQQDIQQSAIEAESILAASHTVDAPAANPPHAAKRLVLVMMSGLIVGTALGVAVVLFHALLSNRLRRRDEVALALGRPVRFSAGTSRSWWSRRERLDQRGVDVLAAGFGTALTDGAKVERVALVSVGAVKEAALVVSRLADHLASVGQRVCVVDLSESGALAETGHVGGWAVLHPGGTAATTPGTGPLTLVSAFSGKPAPGEPGRDEWAKAQIVLVLGDAQLGVGAAPLSSWADQAVLLVRAGRASAEFLDSVGRVFDASGLGIDFAMLVGADAGDESPGFPAGVAGASRVSRSS